MCRERGQTEKGFLVGLARLIRGLSCSLIWSRSFSLFLKYSYTVLDLQPLLQSLTNRLIYILDHMTSQTFSQSLTQGVIFSVTESQSYDPLLLRIHTHDHVLQPVSLGQYYQYLLLPISFSHAHKHSHLFMFRSLRPSFCYIHKWSLIYSHHYLLTKFLAHTQNHHVSYLFTLKSPFITNIPAV